MWKKILKKAHEDKKFRKQLKEDFEGAVGGLGFNTADFDNFNKFEYVTKDTALRTFAPNQVSDSDLEALFAGTAAAAFNDGTAFVFKPDESSSHFQHEETDTGVPGNY